MLCHRSRGKLDSTESRANRLLKRCLFRPPGECLWKKSGWIVERPLISPSNQWTVDLPLALSGSLVGFLLSKLLPLLVLPLGLALLLCSCRMRRFSAAFAPEHGRSSTVFRAPT